MLKLGGCTGGTTSTLPTGYQREPSLGSQVSMLLLAVPAIVLPTGLTRRSTATQPFRSQTSHYLPPPAAQSSSATPPVPYRSACRVSAAYPGTLARGSASPRVGSCGRPRRFAPRCRCAPRWGGAQSSQSYSRPALSSRGSAVGHPTHGLAKFRRGPRVTSPTRAQKA